MFAKYEPDNWSDHGLSAEQKKWANDVELGRLITTAYHEAGHAVVALHCNYACCPVIELSPKSKKDGAFARWTGMCSSDTAEDPRNRALVSMAREIAEQLAGGLTDSAVCAKVLWWVIDVTGMSQGDRTGMLDLDDDNYGLTQSHVDDCVAILRGSWGMVESIVRQTLDEAGAQYLQFDGEDLAPGWCDKFMAAYRERHANEVEGSVYEAEALAQERCCL